MKITLFLSAFWLAIAGLFTSNEETVLTGVVTDGKEALIGVSVTVLQDMKVVKGSTTDVNGKYRIALEPGKYSVEFAYTGFETLRYSDVVVAAGSNTLDATLKGGSVLEEVVITSRKPTNRTETRSAMEVRGFEPMKKAKRERSDSAGAPPPPPGTPAPETAVAPVVYAPAAGEAKPLPLGKAPGVVTKEKAVKSDDLEYALDEIVTDKDMPSSTTPTEDTDPGVIPQPKPRAGLLTAGEWNDLHNWNKHWVDLLADGEINAYQDMYGFFPSQRYTLLLTNDQDFPLADVPVQLKNNGDIVWEARTDNTGKAELWSGMFDKKELFNLTLEAWVNGKKHEIKNPKSAKSGFNFLKVATECFAPKNVDIVWAVDATGSMGDELEYLKTELLDVIGRAQHNNPALDFRMGTAFYRDKGDEYIVKTSGLSPDIHRTVDFIKDQFAAGGGDYPEAVHSALEEVVYNQKWSENAIARICFIVLDASPHNEPEVKASLQKTIREAAKRGIRIVPLTASGIQKDTEFLMKFFGLATNGTYLFLTDHSGIGGKHLEPTTDEYKVEALNDLLVRIITEYTSIETCEGKSNIRFVDDPQQQPGENWQATYYPNPAVDRFTLELPFEVQSVTLYDSEGNSVRKLEKPQAGPNVIQINELPAGFYTIRINNNGKMQSGKLMVVRS